MIHDVGKVLFIEDSQIDAFIHSKVIRFSGLSSDMHHCLTAREALEYLSGLNSHMEVPALIFLDIRMPDLDGFEFLEEFGQLDSFITDTCKIIMLSSSIDEQDLNKARSNPYVMAFVPKPLTIEKIRELFD